MRGLAYAVPIYAISSTRVWKYAGGNTALIRASQPHSLARGVIIACQSFMLQRVSVGVSVVGGVCGMREWTATKYLQVYNCLLTSNTAIG